MILAVDLPAISPETIASVVGAAAAGARPGQPLVAIVADRHGRGTNVLLVSPPDAIPFAFGELQLGTWQSIVFVDLNVDNPVRKVRLSFLAG